MTIKEKEEIGIDLYKIINRLSYGEDFYDERGSVVAHKAPTREALAVVDLAGVLYKILDTLEVDQECLNEI